MENTENVSTAEQTTCNMLDNFKLSSPDAYNTINTASISSIDTSGWPNNVAWTAYQTPETSAKLDEIKEYLKDNLEAVNNKINSILDLIYRENDDFIDTYNNMLQYLIGQKQTIINIQKLF